MMMNKIGRQIVTAALCSTFVCGVGAFAPLESGLIGDAEAASYYTAVNDSHVKVRLPKVLKSVISAPCTEGHTSGAFHTDCYLKGMGSSACFMRVDGMDSKNNYSLVSSKMTRKYKGTESYGVEWSLKNKTGNSGWVFVRNIYCSAWENANEESYWSSAQIKAVNKLIKIYSNGKMSYSKVVKLSKSKAISMGNKAVKAYAKKYIIPNIYLQ